MLNDLPDHASLLETTTTLFARNALFLAMEWRFFFSFMASFAFICFLNIASIPSFLSVMGCTNDGDSLPTLPTSCGTW